MDSITLNSKSDNTQVETIRNYYRLQARIYQATRWSFLFGRKQMITALKLPWTSEKTIVEVGCGTGHNLYTLAKNYKNLQLIGIDISTDMLSVAAKKLQRFAKRVVFLEKPYAPGHWNLPAKPDIILFSYCLTMINPGWEAALQRASEDLSEGGAIAVVDFYGSRFGFFRRWMGFNHVRMEQHLLPVLEKLFKTVHLEVHQAYGGLWTYFLFVGEK
jgi:S-adenosylmethionine-diacylgycerolhomoserine-N-methlytransferase